MLAERGVSVDLTRLYRWVQRYAPEMEKRLRWYWRHPGEFRAWHIDETYVKVNAALSLGGWKITPYADFSQNTHGEVISHN